ncbi:MAG: phenylalanine--tRNA ligase subunit alpha [Candidatus Hydrogenedentes bacterium]|nr:phenylalanine--tRNA ligase subunit alpha [Candidatus Hydrogenedentota bacterium]
METELQSLIDEARTDLQSAADIQSIEQLRITYLGRNGRITAILRRVGSLPPEERPKIGQLANAAKQQISQLIDQQTKALTKTKAAEKPSPSLDISLPGKRTKLGHIHPLTATVNRVVDIFAHLGFDLMEGPEIESEYYNFISLNMPDSHPARDMQDTFYINDKTVLRTHTSPVQTRTMEQIEPPVRVVAVGKCYRRDADASHSPMFYQIEGFAVDVDITMADLKDTLVTFAHMFFNADVKTRLRTSYFPFTEPSAELDVECAICNGAGCRVCGHSGWSELLGCGMIHPKVFEHVGYDYEKFSGFAFGMGLDRVTMAKHSIDEIRLLYENDLRFLEQF